MSDSVLIELGKLANRISDAGLRVTASLLTKVFGDRSPEDNERWDEETRQSVQKRTIEALASGIHTEPRLEPEIPISDLRSIKELPPIDGGRFSDASSSTEINALEAAGAVRVDGSNVTVPDPPRLLSGIMSLLADSSTWSAFSHQLGRPDLFHDIVAPVSSTLKRLVSYNHFLRIYAHLAVIYGVRVRTIPASEIYKGANAFVTRAGTATALTNSTSAGAIDPLERFGTDKILSDLGIRAESEIGARIKKKDAWRVCNFRDGLLNPELPAHRPYFFDKAVTREVIESTLSALPVDKHAVYKEMAATCLAEAAKCPGFELYEVDKFAPWMWRLTRSAPGYVLISLRHPDTRAIDEGIELTFRDPGKLHEFYQGVFNISAGVVAPVAWPLALAFIVAGVGERYFFRDLDESLLHKNAEEDMRTHSKRVRIGEAEVDWNLRSAKQYIETLIA